MYSVGVDIVQIKRLENIINNENLRRKIFTESEITYASLKANPMETYAGLFASKEATLKSLKKGLEGSPLKDIEIIHENGIPSIMLHGKIKEEIELRKLDFSISISHDGDYAISTVIAFNS